MRAKWPTWLWVVAGILVVVNLLGIASGYACAMWFIMALLYDVQDRLHDLENK